MFLPFHNFLPKFKRRYHRLVNHAALDKFKRNSLSFHSSLLSHFATVNRFSSRRINRYNYVSVGSLFLHHVLITSFSLSLFSSAYNLDDRR